MSIELKEALQRLQSRPTIEVVAEAQKLVVSVASNFSSKEEVETAAAILAHITLGEGTFTGISCTCPRFCTESSIIYGWMQAEQGYRFHIPPEVRTELADRMVVWKRNSSHCTCVVGSKMRASRHEDAKAAKEEEARKLYEDYMRNNGHICGAVMDA